MNKKSVLLGGAAVLALIYVVGAKLISNEIEAGVTRTVNAYSTQIGYPVEIKNFKNGWFSSSFDLGIPLPSNMTAPLADLGLQTIQDKGITFLNFNTEILHGPVIFADGFRFDAAYASGEYTFDIFPLLQRAMTESTVSGQLEERSAAAEKIAEFVKSLTSRYTINIDFDGNVVVNSHTNGASIDLALPNSENDFQRLNASIGEMSATWTLDKAAQNSDIGLDWTGMHFTLSGKGNEQVSFLLGPVAVEGKLQEYTDGLWAGDTLLKSGELNITSSQAPTPVNFGFSSITLEALTSMLSEDLLSYRSKMLFEGLSLSAQENTIALDEIALDIEFENIFIPLLAEYNSFSKAVISEALIHGQETSELKDFVDEVKVKQILDKQLSSSPKVLVHDYRITRDNESVRVDGDVRLLPGLTLELIQSQTLSETYKFIEGQFTGFISPKLVKSLVSNVKHPSLGKLSEEQISQGLDAQFQQYQQMGFLVPDGEDFSITIDIKHDMLGVNGRPVMQLSQSIPISAHKP